MKNRQNLFFRATFRSSIAAGVADRLRYPYLGYPQGANNVGLLDEAVAVDFTQFVGFFDANGNGSIEPLGALFQQRPEAFRGLSITGVERDAFGFRDGPRFPFQLFSQPQLGRANGMIYAGAIVMNGAPLPYKAEDGDGTGRVSPTTGQGATTKPLDFAAIFMAIPFLEAGGLITLADIQLGNLNQKLMTTVTTNPLQTSPTGFGQINSVTTNRQTAISTGDIKGAQTGLSVTAANGDVFDATVFIDSITWQTDYIRDDRILDVVSTGQ